MHTIYIYTLEITNDTNCFQMIGVETEHFRDFSALIWQTYSSMTNFFNLFINTNLIWFFNIVDPLGCP